MYSNDYYELMDKINLVINYIENALLAQNQIVNFVLEDKGLVMEFAFKDVSKKQTLLQIRKASEESFKDMYASLMDHFNNPPLGATMEYKNKKAVWNLAPVIADKVLLEFVSPKEEDQKWFYEELVKSTTQEKGLK